MYIDSSDPATAATQRWEREVSRLTAIYIESGMSPPNARKAAENEISRRRREAAKSREQA